MVNFIDRMGYAVDSGFDALIHACIKVKRGCMIVGEGSSRVMYEIYSLEGFEKWSKAAVSNLKLISLIPGVNGIFDGCIKTLEAQKDLCYATLVFASTADFIRVIKDEETGATLSYEFKLPTVKEKQADGTYKEKYDIVKIMYGIGNFFETGKFLQKYKIYNFPLFSQAAIQLGSFKLFTLNGRDVTFGDIPVFNCWCDKPKDFFVFIAASHTVWKCVNKSGDEFWTFENLAKLTGNTGKITLIAGASYLSRNKYVVALTFLSALTDTASLCSTMARRKRERESRLNDPTKP